MHKRNVRYHYGALAVHLANMDKCLSLNDRRLSIASFRLTLAALLRDVLPPHLHIASGRIVEHTIGAYSRRIDLLIYDRSLLPSFFQDPDFAFFPTESVLYCLHIIPSATPRDIKRAHLLAREVDDFPYWRFPQRHSQIGPTATPEKIRHVMVSLNLDRKNTVQDTLKRYKAIYDDDERGNSIHAICGLGESYNVDDGHSWIERPSVNKNDELLALLADILNTYQSILSSRQVPPLGNYLMPRTATRAGPMTGGLRSVLFSCKRCEKSGYASPASIVMNEVVIGTLKHIAPCPKCGSEMRSVPGRYEFRKRRLVDAVVEPMTPQPEPRLTAKTFSVSDYFQRLGISTPKN